MTKIQCISVIALAWAATACALPSNKHRVYPGWEGIEYMFIFGDSYTETGFNSSLAQPSRANPLGNPAYPGYTASNGPNWIDFLTTTYNRSFIETVNLASGGATVDSSLVAPYKPTVRSVRDQVEKEYLPIYSSKPSFLPWTSSNTLFGIFIGINDIGNSYQNRNSSINSLIFNVYAGLVDKLYQSGARNFLFLNVPPVDRSPLTVAQGLNATRLEAVAIADWNFRVAGLAANLSRTYYDATTFLFDTNSVFNEVLDNPRSFYQTSAYKNTTGFCPAYVRGTRSWYHYDPSCGLRVDQYFWLNNLHPTFRIHNVTAGLISRRLSKGR